MNVLKEHIPVKQGLRRYKIFHNSNILSLKEHIPVKQGLRLIKLITPTGGNVFLKEHIPVKQGLRHLSFGLG